jgi:signal transduction histidine kinase
MTSSRLLRTVLGVTFLALVVLLMWSRTLSPLVLLLAGLTLAAGLVLELRRIRREGSRPTIPLAMAALGLALLTATATTARLEWGARQWDRVAEGREAQLAARLGDRLGGTIRRAEAAAELAAAARLPSFGELEAIRSRTNVDALVVVDAAGRSTVWAGEHRGRIAGPVVLGAPGVHFPGGTLFDYLYVIRPTPDGGRAVAAVLLQAGPPLRGQISAFAAHFEALTGERPRFGSGPGIDATWTLITDRGPVLHARFAPVSQGEWRGRVARTGRRLLFGLVLLGLGFLSAAWLRSLPDRRGLAAMVPIGALSITLMAAPLRRTLGLDRLFSPGWFMLPIPGDFVIEGVMVVLLPAAALIATLLPGGVRRSDLWLRLVTGGALAGGGFAVLTGVMTGSAGPPMLTSAAPLWYVLHPTTVVLLTVLAALLFPRAKEEDVGGRLVLYGVAGVALASFLALALAGSWRPGTRLPTPVLLAWSVPFVLLGRAVAGYRGQGERLTRWLAAGWLAATAVIPHLWIASQMAKLEQAEAEVASFGGLDDPFLVYLLDELAEDLQATAEQGGRGVDLLYEAWVSSGLAGEPYPLEISLWGPDLRREANLPLGVQMEPGSQAQVDLLDVVTQAIGTGQTVSAAGTGTAVSRILAVPLGPRGAVSVAVAPRASLQPTSALTTFMAGELQRGVQVEMFPASPDVAGPARLVAWQKTENGWRSETRLRDGQDVFHAHLELYLPPPGIRLARGMLLITIDLVLLSLLWALGRLARGDPPVPPGGFTGWMAGFRARLILALFTFFLLPTAVLGWAAYRALAGEVTRAARQVAERAVVHAATVVPRDGLAEAARRTGEDLLYYQRGTLDASSMPEAAELGLYSAWMPADLYARMRAGEALAGTEMGTLANRSYLVAYRRLRNPAEMVAVPVWLASRDVAVRQREFAHLVLFGALVGGLLSLILSVLVGRTLAQPIGELRRAAAAVGRGRLRVRLPQNRADEFGELFTSFNRMTRRLRRARAQEVRTARILAWGEMARQVAHEIKNPLTPIKLSIQHIRRAHRDRRPDFEGILESNVDQILEEIERLTEIAKAFSRYGAPEEAAGATEPVDVAATARDVLTLYSAPDRSVRYRLTVADEDCVAAARTSELREVIVNLLENARAAVGEAGSVEVCVEGPDRTVRLEVRDDGEGIPAEQLPRIFEPHFSTRSSGTGLGLAIVRRLVESWGGEVGAESEAGIGTTVWMTIPKNGPGERDAPARGQEAGAE